MGVSSATEEFQHALTQALSGLEGVRNLVDDMAIYMAYHIELPIIHGKGKSSMMSV